MYCNSRNPNLQWSNSVQVRLKRLQNFESGESDAKFFCYSLSNGVKPETNANGDFRVFHEKKDGKDYAVIRNLKNLDADKIPKYTLTLTAQDLRNGLSREKKLIVKLVSFISLFYLVYGVL